MDSIETLKTSAPGPLDSTARVRFANILYTTDLTAAAERGLPYAIEIARRYHAMLYAAHVLNTDSYSTLPPVSWPKLIESEEASRREFRQHLEQQLATMPHEIIFLGGETWPTLAGIVEDKKIELVVLSTHGTFALEKAILGSVAEEIFRHSPCPVLTVGPYAPVKPWKGAELGQVLYATDFSTESLAAAPYAISIAREHRARLILLTCHHGSEDVHALRQTLQEIVPFGAELRCEPDCIVERGRPANKILEVAESHGVDMIVLGVRGAEHFPGRQLANSGSYHIVANAVCPVLTVRS